MTQKILEEAKQRLQEVEDGIATMQARYRECITKKEELELKCELCEQRMGRADKVHTPLRAGPVFGACSRQARSVWVVAGSRGGCLQPLPSTQAPGLAFQSPPHGAPSCSSSTVCPMRRCVGRRQWRTWSTCLKTSLEMCCWRLASWPTWAPSQ